MVGILLAGKALLKSPYAKRYQCLLLAFGEVRLGAVSGRPIIAKYEVKILPPSALFAGITSTAQTE